MRQLSHMHFNFSTAAGCMNAHNYYCLTVTSPLTFAILDESCSTAGVAAESRKHVANDPKCFELEWTCVPLAVETYGNWGVEAQETFSHLASLLAASHNVSKSKATADIYGRLNLTLTRSVAKAILTMGLRPI